MDLYIRLRSFEDVRALADLATAQPFRVWISDGRQWAEANSLMYLFSLDLRAPLALHAECSEEASEDLRTLLGDFVVSE